jgi:hypothetical protein
MAFLREEGLEAEKPSARWAVGEPEASQRFRRGGYAASEREANERSGQVPPSAPSYHPNFPFNIASLHSLSPPYFCVRLLRSSRSSSLKGKFEGRTFYSERFAFFEEGLE